MKCDVAQLEISARLDGARTARLDEPFDQHMTTCATCRRFESRARQLRDGVRLEPAREVPDLVPGIMAAIRTEPRTSPLRRSIPRPDLRRWGRPAAAFLAGAAASAVLLSGLPFQRAQTPAFAKEIPQLVAAAAKDVDLYRASFEIIERNFRPEVPERRFEAEVWFGAPEIFGAEIRDRTTYPSDAWLRNDTGVAVDGSRWSIWNPAPCEKRAVPICESNFRSVRGREPFDGDALLPSDIVVPVGTLAGTDHVEVLGRGEVLHRRVLNVALPYSDATPLFAYLHAAGSWRPFFPSDRVVASLDVETWFPLAYEVRASESPQRHRWAAARGLPDESSGEKLFSVRATQFTTTGSPAVARTPTTPDTRDAGFRDVSFASIADRVGFEPLVPRDLAGLKGYRAGVFGTGSRPRDETLLSFAQGLAWLKIRQTRQWSQPTLYGNVGTLASEIVLPNGGVAYYEPATATLGRRLSIHAKGWDIYVETNLTRAELQRVAGSMPVVGERVPDAWNVRTWAGGIERQRVTLRQATRRAPYALYPTRLPYGYRLAVVHVVRTAGSDGITFYFRRDGAEPDGVGLKLHQTRADVLPPPMDPDTFVLKLEDATARYSIERSELEWVEAGVYRSLTGPSADLGTLLDVARSLSRPDDDA
jgi:hypothetical protein